MSFFGKPLSEYVAFCKPFLILIPVLGLVKLALSLGGVPFATTWWLSINALTWAGLLYYSIRVHTSGFGTYRHLLVICVLLNLSGQIISMLGIVIGLLGTDNAYVYAFGVHETTWSHLAAHLFFGTTVGSLVAWVLGSLILAITRKVTGAAPRTSRSTV
jgi:hypothetical protein